MSKPIRVLHVVGIMNLGGTENMIMNLYRRIDKNKVQFDFVQNTDQPAAFDEEILAAGGRIFRCPRYNGKNHFSYVKWWRNFFSTHQGEYTAVHGHLGSTAAIYLPIAKEHGIYTIAHSHSTGASLIYQMFSFPTRFIADYFFACSNAAATIRYGKRVARDGDRCKVLKNAIDSKRFEFNPTIRQNIRESLNIDDDCFLLGHVGQFRKEKNHLFLLTVFEEICKQHANVKLLLVGDGELHGVINNEINAKQLQDKVIVTGAKHNTQDYYQAMDVFVFPSVYEGLGIVALEAQTSGLECFVSNGVPNDIAIVDELVHFYSIEDGPEKWAEVIMSHSYKNRMSRTADIQRAGYDIEFTSKWLQDFYLQCRVSTA